MDWIKRNLGLVISGVVAVLAIGGSGYFFYLQYAADQDAQAKLDTARNELKTLQASVPFPNQTNLALLKEQANQLTGFVGRASRLFGEVQTNDLSRTVDFGAALAKTLNDLTLEAKNASVTVPTNFAFGFTVQRDSAFFDPTNITRLYTELEDIRNVCQILFKAKVYELVRIQRVAVGTNDTSAASGLNANTLSPVSDYLSSTRTFVTNDIALIYPYQITFRCSTIELASALECLARAPYGINVKWLKVEPSENQPQETELSPTGAPMFTPRYGGMSAAMQARYGIGPYGRRYAPQAAPGGEGTEGMTPVKKKGPGTILKERPIKVAMYFDVIRLKGSP